MNARSESSRRSSQEQTDGRAQGAPVAISQVDAYKSPFKSIFENATQAMYQSTPEGRFLCVNPAFARMFGYKSPQQVMTEISKIGTQFHANPEDQRTFQLALYKKGRVDEFEFLARRKDQSLVWVAESAWVCYGEKGDIVRYEGILRDISKRKQTEIQLQETLERMEFALHAANIALWDWYVRTGRLVINDQWAKILGYSRDELEPLNIQTWKDLCHPEDLKVAETLLERHLSGNAESYACEVRMRHKDGFWVWVQDQGRVVAWDQSGQSIRVTGVHIDITERKHYEQQLRFLSLHDQLTGLYNRTYFENELFRLQKSREFPISIICCDVDGLKLINDTLGHQHGDMLLKTCAQTLQACFRDSDVLARVGGDEFVALLPRTQLQDGQKIVDRIKENIAIYNQEHLGHLPLHISVGLATGAETSAFLEGTYKEADDRMYQDKLQRKEEVIANITASLIQQWKKRFFLTKKSVQQLVQSSLQLGREVGLSERQLADLSLLARVFDLGMITIPEHILRKNSPLSEDEWDMLRQHPYKGYRIAIACKDLEHVAELILKHHERWDGKGYPQGLSGEEIPIECRILAIVSAYAAMTSQRPYCRTKTQDEALKEIRRCAGTQFDPGLVDVFLQSFLSSPVSRSYNRS